MADKSPNPTLEIKILNLIDSKTALKNTNESELSWGFIQLSHGIAYKDVAFYKRMEASPKSY